MTEARNQYHNVVLHKVKKENLLQKILKSEGRGAAENEVGKGGRSTVV